LIALEAKKQASIGLADGGTDCRTYRTTQRRRGAGKYLANFHSDAATHSHLLAPEIVGQIGKETKEIKVIGTDFFSFNMTRPSSPAALTPF
jgi:hypothetical protein